MGGPRWVLVISVPLAITLAAGAIASTQKVNLDVRAAVLTKTGDRTWTGAVRSAQLGTGQLALTGAVTFREDGEPSRSKLRVRVTTKNGWLRACFRNTILLRPGQRFVWDGPGRVTGTSSSLRRYRRLEVRLGGRTSADDLTHAKPFGFGSGPPGLRRC